MTSDTVRNTKKGSRSRTPQSVALVGAPNVGKSVIFNKLADDYVDVSNYPGTTIETTSTRTNGFILEDTPGVYGISSFSESEEITRDLVLDSDAVINVVDATHLERDLFLTLQLLDMGIPTIVALNMMDEVRADGIDLRVKTLEESLGVPVVPTVAVENRGLDELIDRINEANAPDQPEILGWFDELPEVIEADRCKKTLLVEADKTTVSEFTNGQYNGDEEKLSRWVDQKRREDVYENRRDRVESLLDRVQTYDERRSDSLSSLLLDPLTGTPIALGLLALIYFFIGDLVAQRLVDFLEITVFGQYYNPAVRSTVDGLLADWSWLEPFEFILINKNLGLLTTVVQYSLGVLLPLVVAFCLVISALEDSGVLPRLAVLTNRGLSRIGLNGRAVVPMIVGIGCVTMAVITTRMTGKRRERIIATALLGLAIPCSAQLGVIVGLMAGLGLLWWFSYIGVLLVVLGLAGLALDRVLPGESQGLVEELPRMRVPRPTNILRKTISRTRMFLYEAIPLFGATAIIVSIFDYAGFLRAIQESMAPITGFLGMPQGFAQVLILGLIRRDFAAAGMTDLALSSAQTFVGLVVITLFVPCILAMILIAKERDLRTGLLMWIGSWMVAFSVGGLLAAVMGI